MVPAFKAKRNSISVVELKNEKRFPDLNKMIESINRILLNE